MKQQNYSSWCWNICFIIQNSFTQKELFSIYCKINYPHTTNIHDNNLFCIVFKVLFRNVRITEMLILNGINLSTIFTIPRRISVFHSVQQMLQIRNSYFMQFSSPTINYHSKRKNAFFCHKRLVLFVVNVFVTPFQYN